MKNWKLTKQEIDAMAFYYASKPHGRIDNALYEAKKKELKDWNKSKGAQK